ncbi:hypothetical protein F2Q69_00032933 [Brassica cretica]|uniref:HMA domain-containing protein n=1 Tax=Brassica cretica TaxID=69181 RepID=A0A8S9SVP1_BRACR|nr:hypothetical protein F2Q69_00032933 [Brassica cretica]
MESTFAAFSTITAMAPSLPLLTISKALHRHFSGARHLRPLLLARSSPASRSLGCFRASRIVSSSSLCYRTLGAAVLPVIRRRLQCLSSSSPSFRSISSGGGGGFGGYNGGSGGGGGGGSDSGDLKAKLGGGVSVPSSDIIILDVGGMTCGGCSASVKKILESQPQVATASVNLTTETAIVWPVPEAKSVPDWQKTLGEALANHLTNCGFDSTPRDLVTENFFKVFESKTKDKQARLKQSGRELAVSWALCAVCLVGHVTHFLGVKAPWLHAVHSTGFHVSLCLLTLLGPGRQLILDGFKSLLKGSPNMNTLVGLGAMSSFSVSSLAALIPKLGWKTFFEEPVMLIAFVLLGRNLEQRAKIKATSDMTGLLSVLPSKARLLLDGDSTVEVPCNSLSVGDLVIILPGAEDGTFTEEPGSGAVAIVNNKRVAVGTLEWVQRHGATGNILNASEENESNNQSVVYIGVDNTLAAVIRFEDKIREDAAQVVENLTRQGIDVYMLSGDKKNAANYVASVVGIPQDRVISGVKPAEKKKFINELQKNKNIVAMVGDGINDAAALASSDVGVAMGGGAGAASEVSPVVLMGNRLTQLLDAMELSRQTMKTVKQNLWWAFGYNIVGIPVAAGVLLPLTGTMLTPSMAGALMGVSSLGVMTNSLLLRYRFFSNREDKNVKWEPKEGTKQSPHENTRLKESS